MLRALSWSAFADCSQTPFPGKPDPRKLCLKSGFDPAYLYELVYTAKDPKVLGIGFAAIRDLNSYLRYATTDDTGSPRTALRGRIAATVSQGNSQSGNYIRSFINLGFNQDEAGRIVFDGANPNIARAPTWRDGTSASRPQQRSGRHLRSRKRRRSLVGGLSGRCPASSGGGRLASIAAAPAETCPKIVETFGSSEFYNLRASPDLVGTRADHDIPLPPNVRRYYFPGVRHGGGPGGFNPEPQPDPTSDLAPNPNPSSDTLRALQTALVAWVVKGALPPPSQYPRLDRRGNLVAPTQAALGFPVIPGLPLPDGILTPLYQYDFGSRFHYNDLSGVITMQPPPIRQVLPTVVPKVDADGNEVAGVASVLHQVPLGTYTGWNTNAGGFYKGYIRTNTGGYIPFAKTKAQRRSIRRPAPFARGALRHSRKLRRPSPRRRRAPRAWTIPS